MHRLFIGLLMSALPAIAAQRLAVPDYLSCDRNQLTAWMGVVTYLSHRGGSLSLRMSTDFQTVESLALKRPDTGSLMAQMRLHGAPFTQNDWSLLYRTNGVVRSPLRAVIWLCADREIPPVINWQPVSEP